MGFLSREIGEKLTTTGSENTDKEEGRSFFFFLFKYLNISSSSVKKKFMLKYPLEIHHV